MSLFRRKEQEQEQVKCRTCKHYVDRFDAQEVIMKKLYWLGEYKVYFCPLHIVPYEKIVCDSALIDGSITNRYFKMCEVDEKGKPIKK